jgi:hypothetical protein
VLSSARPARSDAITRLESVAQDAVRVVVFPRTAVAPTARSAFGGAQLFLGSAQCSDAMMVAMASVEVKQSGAGETMSFDVMVTEASGATSHRVTLDASQFERLRGGDENPARFIERCFEFLLAREAKESVMSSFDVSVISRYFPEFEREIST